MDYRSDIIIQSKKEFAENVLELKMLQKRRIAQRF